MDIESASGVAMVDTKGRPYYGRAWQASSIVGAMACPRPGVGWSLVLALGWSSSSLSPFSIPTIIRQQSLRRSLALYTLLQLSQQVIEPVDKFHRILKLLTQAQYRLIKKDPGPI
jgi:hypothetical protein